ncbi:hypothetical protein L209DRAFT_403211 [Thermothelomyces heterothallicus CBS 203.75]
MLLLSMFLFQALFGTSTTRFDFTMKPADHGHSGSRPRLRLCRDGSGKIQGVCLLIDGYQFSSDPSLFTVNSQRLPSQRLPSQRLLSQRLLSQRLPKCCPV